MGLRYASLGDSLLASSAGCGTMLLLGVSRCVWTAYKFIVFRGPASGRLCFKFVKTSTEWDLLGAALLGCPSYSSSSGRPDVVTLLPLGGKWGG